MPVLQRSARPAGPERLLLLRGLPGRGGAGGASGRPALRRLARRRGHAGRPASGDALRSHISRRRRLLGAQTRQIVGWMGRKAGLPRTTSEEATGETAMTARVPMVSLERARELGEAMGMPARRTQSEAFRTLANNPGVARVAYSQLMQLLENNKFDTRLRELMIMRIGWVTGSAYEWTNHWRVATTAGIPPEDILAVRDWRNSARLTPADKAILAATDECLAGKSISDGAWAEVAKHVTDPGQQVEFIIAMGNRMMFSLLLRNLRIPLAEGVAVWPPDGLASPAAAG